MVQTLIQIEQALLDEIDCFQIPDTSDRSQCVGVPWSTGHYQGEIAKMREYLIPPYWCLVTVGGMLVPGGPIAGSAKRFAAVAKDPDSNYFLFFDPESQMYALGFEQEAAFSTFLYGDAVGTFLAR